MDILEEDAPPPEGVVSPDEFWEIYEAASPEKVAIDTESPTFRWHLASAHPYCVTFYWGEGAPYFLRIQEPDTGYDDEDSAVAEVLRRVMIATPRLVYHNAKYDLHVTKRLFDRFGLPLVARTIDDTMIQSFVTNENRYHGLKELCVNAGIKMGDEDADALKEQVNAWLDEQEKFLGRRPSFVEVPDRLLVPYARQDPYLTWHLSEEMDADIEHQMDTSPRKGSAKRDVRDIYDLEMRLLWVIFGAEERGMRVDLEFIHRRISELTPQVADLKARCDELVGWPMNPGSTEDVAKVLQEMEIDTSVWINPKSGREKLPEWVLDGLIKSSEDPRVVEVCEMVLEYRGATKVLSTYFEPLAVDCQDDGTGQMIVRCNIKQTGARTGRTSVTDPPLQTLPRTKGQVREAFIAREGHKLIFADYSQQELRVLAHYMVTGANDRSMAKIFDDPDADLHVETAVSIYGVPADKLEPHMRPNAKDTNFAIVYGAGVPKMRAILGAKTDEEGDQYLKKYHGRFPGIRILKRKTKQGMDGRGFILTEFGRRHRDGSNGRHTYKAVNSLVQGTSADLSKAAMIKIDDELRREGMKALILLMVHDEIIVEAPDEELEQTLEIVRRSMVQFDDVFCVPLDVEIKSDDRWRSKSG